MTMAWFDKIKTSVEWDTADQIKISKLRQCLDPDLVEVVEALSTHLAQFKDEQSLMANARFVERLHSALQEWVTGPLDGTFDEEYARARQALVQKLIEVDVTFEDVILLEGLSREKLLGLAQAQLTGGSEPLSDTMRALDKALRLDLALMHTGYIQARDAEIERSLLDRFLAITGFSRTLYENLAEAREWESVTVQQAMS
jgi:hypothetical protein